MIAVVSSTPSLVAVVSPLESPGQDGIPKLLGEEFQGWRECPELLIHKDPIHTLPVIGRGMGPL